MSVAATTWAFKQDCPSGPRFVLVALADAADSSGVTWKGQVKIAAMTGFSLRTVVNHMQALEDSGLIKRQPRTRPNGSKTSDYTLLGPGGDRGDMDLPDPEEVPATLREWAEGGPRADSARAGFARPSAESARPDPLGEPLELQGEGARAGAPGEPCRVKFNGKPVKKDAWILTEQVLAAFNEEMTGMGWPSNLRLLTSSGQPSKAAGRIYGRIVMYPDITLDKHRDIIRRTLLSKWWGTGRPSIGVVYGPDVFEDNITRPGTPRGGGPGGKQSASDLIRRLRER